MIPIVRNMCSRDYANRIYYDIIKLPESLIDLIRDGGFQIYIVDRDPKWIGIKGSEDRIGEEYKYSCYCDYINHLIVMNSQSFDPADLFSTTIHEIAHALDHVITDTLKTNFWFMSEDHIRFPVWDMYCNDNALDWYADINSREYFAQALEAYHQPERTKHYQSYYYEHTIDELAYKDPDLFRFIQEGILTI